jgi:capsular exopolysaccharide synthesis family protein
MSNSEFTELKESQNTSVNLREEINKYLRNWHWFLLCIVVFVSIAYLRLRYTPSQYGASSKILVLSENQSSPQMAILSDLDVYTNKEEAVLLDQIEIMKSRDVLAEVARKLKLNVRIFSEGKVIDSELYPKAPFTITFIESDSLLYTSRANFRISIKSESSFIFFKNENDTGKLYSYGDNIETQLGSVIITPSPNNTSNINGTYTIRVSPLIEVAEYYKRKISIAPLQKSSKIVTVYLTEQVKKKAVDIVNTLVEVYNEKSVNDKNLEAKATIDFLTERVNTVSQTLNEIDNSAANFKTSQGLTDISSEAGIYLSSEAENDKELVKTNIELNLTNSMINHLSNETTHKLLPSNIGLTDPTITTLTTRYNELIHQRENLLKSSGVENPVVKRLDQQLSAIKLNLNQSLDNLGASLNIRMDNLKTNRAIINSKIAAVPGQEQQFTDIVREQNIIAGLYTYLLEKREEATIAFKATSPNAKIIEDAYNSSSAPVYPNKKMFYLGALALGFICPFLVIYLNNLLDNKVHNKLTVESLLRNISVVGEVPSVKKGRKSKILITKNDRSVLAEAFRIIRTNLDYLRRVRKVDKHDNVFFVTSTIQGEGKTFFSMNLAMTFVNSNKRVLVVGADIRSPRIHEFIAKNKLNRNLEFGLTDYLFDESLTTQDIIRSYMVGENKIDILLPGKTPPNPAELLMSERMEELFDDVSSKYDIVIVDTAPTLLVTDTLLISQYAGHTIYLTRAGHTEKKLLKFAQELHDEGKLKGMMMVVNDVKQANSGYGGKYGYGYGVEKKKGFFRRKSA